MNNVQPTSLPASIKTLDSSLQGTTFITTVYTGCFITDHHTHSVQTLATITTSFYLNGLSSLPFHTYPPSIVSTWLPKGGRAGVGHLANMLPKNFLRPVNVKS